MFVEYLFFLAKLITIVAAILILVFGVAVISSKGKSRSKEKLEIKKINDRFDEMERQLRQKILHKHLFKVFLKKQKQNAKEDQAQSTARKRIFVLNFQGDVRATAVKHLREEITALLTVANSEDKVVLCLESPGGIVPGYGLAASQLRRIREQNIPLIIIIDKVAASGGYMMAAVADTILAAPFAIVGSIGVIAQIPNFNRLLKKNNIEFEQVMAGQYKRTLTLFGENTEEGRAKLQDEVNETQELFKSFVSENRPIIDIDKVATGEHWYGQQAIDLNLIDGISTSDDYLLTASKTADIFEICFSTKKSILEKFSNSVQKSFDYCLSHLRY